MTAITKFSLLFLCPLIVGAGTFSTCDVNQDGSTNVADIQRLVNETLGTMPASNDLNQDGKVNVLDVRIGMDAALGLGCLGQPVQTVTDFNPKSGPAGTLVSLTGTLLLSGSGTPVSVLLSAQSGGTLSAPEGTVTANSLTFVVPPGAATGPVKLLGSGVTTSSAASFTVTPSTSFTVSSSPPSANVIVGQSTTYTVNLSSTNGF